MSRFGACFSWKNLDTRLLNVGPQLADQRLLLLRQLREVLRPRGRNVPSVVVHVDLSSTDSHVRARSKLECPSSPKTRPEPSETSSFGSCALQGPPCKARSNHPCSSGSDTTCPFHRRDGRFHDPSAALQFPPVASLDLYDPSKMDLQRCFRPHLESLLSSRLAKAFSSTKSSFFPSMERCASASSQASCCVGFVACCT